MASEAQKRAFKRYYERTKNTHKVYMFRLGKENDADIIAKLDSVPSKVDYLRKIVREDCNG